VIRSTEKVYVFRLLLNTVSDVNSLTAMKTAPTVTKWVKMTLFVMVGNTQNDRIHYAVQYATNTASDHNSPHSACPLSAGHWEEVRYVSSCYIQSQAPPGLRAYARHDKI
jgi:hypothetical protein